MKKWRKTGLFFAALALGLWLGAAEAGAETVSVTLTVPETPYAGESGDLPGSDALFDAYFDRLSFGEPITPFDTHGTLLPTVQMQRIYDFLRSKGEAVAAGSTASTVFSAGTEVIDNSIPYTVGTTAGCDIRLSIPVYYNGSIFTQANGSATMPGSTQPVGDYFVSQITNQVLRLPDIVHGHLLGDCPATFYWYDKTKGYSSSVSFNLMRGPGGQITQINLTGLTMKFQVATDYRADPDNTLTVSTARITAARTAIANARAIVTSHAAESDYQKLISYKNEICDRVYYDHVTLANQEAGQEVGTNTWQLVYAFDNDSTTNIVCEGYAKAFQYLCDLSTFQYPVQCYSVTGLMGGGTGAGGHMWNVVRMGWKTYLVDVTNCDDAAPGYGRPVGYPDKLFLKGGSPAASNRDKYTWSISGSTLNYTYYNGTEGGTRDQRWLYGDLLTLDTADYAQPTAVQPNWYWYADDLNRFVLSTPSELAGFIAMLRTGSRTFLNKTVVLANDIDLSSVVFPSFAGKTPALFNGTFDGQGHTITGLSKVDGVFFMGVHGGTVKNLIADGSVVDSSLDDALVTDCLSLGFPVVKNNLKSTAKVANCASTGSAVVGTNAGTVSNCYYQAAADNDGISGTFAMTAAQFASGEAAWSLQNSRTGLVWGQDIGTDPLPVPTTVAAKRVRQVTFLLESDKLAYATVFVNHGKTAAFPADPVVEGYRLDRWSTTHALTGTAFSRDTAVTKDTVVYAVMRALFGEESGEHAYTKPYRQAIDVELTDLVGYANAQRNENLTFAVESFTKGGAAADSGWLTLSGSALTLRAGAPAGAYAVSVRVSEQAPSYALFSVEQYGAEDIVLDLTLTVTPIAATVAAVPQTIPYGQGIQTGADCARFSAAGNGDVLSAVTLTPSSLDVPGGSISPSAARIVNPDGLDVTASYTLTYVAGKLTVEKVPFPAPAAPGLDAAAPDAVTLTAPTALAGGEALPDGAALEYSADGESWQAALTFDALDPNRAYTFRARLAEDSNHTASPASEALVCTTPKVALADCLVALDLPQGGYVYDGAEKTPAAALTWKGRTVPEGQYAVSYTQNTNAGDAGVTLTGQNDYEGTTSTTFAIAPRPLTGGEVTFALPAGGLVYNGQAQTPAITLTLAGQAVSADQYTAEYAQNRSAGDAQVTLTGKNNHSGTLTGHFPIAPAPVTVQPGTYTVSKPYDGTVSPGRAAGAITCSGILPGDSAVTVTVAHGDYASPDVGSQAYLTAALALSGTGSENYALTAADLSVPCSIRPKTAILTAGNQRITYGGNVAQGPDQVQANGLLPGHRLSAVALTAANQNVPGGALTPSSAVIADTTGRDVTGNYTAVYVPGSLAVDPKAVTVTAEDIALAPGPYIYNAAPQTPAVLSVKDGEAVIPAAEYTVSYQNNVLAGDEAAIIFTDVDRGNYTVSGNVPFSIAKRPLTVTAEDKTAYRGRLLPSLTATADGLAGADTLDGLVLTTGADLNRTASYPIAVSGGSLSNADCYEVTYVSGTLTVLPPKVEKTGAPVWDGKATVLPLAAAPADLLDGAGTTILAARFEGSAMVRVISGTYADSALSFSADLTAQPGWRVFFLDRDISPLCGLLALD